MDTNFPRILCIGALHWDHALHCIEDPVWGESNPCETSKSYGGVAFNIARLLTHLDCVSGLISQLGSDRAGTELLEYLTTTKIEIIHTGSESTEPTATYTAIFDRHGALMLGLADMKIYDIMDKYYWADRTSWLGNWNAWCIDSNLPESGLRYLTTLKNRPRIHLVASSPAKAPRIRSSLGEINTLILNLQEANMILGHSPEGISSAENSAQLLCKAGVDRTIVTQGQRGAAWADSGGSGTKTSRPKKNDSLRTSGAGDALAAGLIAALEKGHSTADALDFGLLASNLFMRTPNIESLITWTKLLRKD